MSWLDKGSAPRELAKRLVALSARLLGTITHVKTAEPAVALTFDDGPHPLYTPRLLDLLREHGARATFFMVGLAAREHPEVVRRVADEGHAIGNHSWDHPSFPLLSRRGRCVQIHWCEEVLPAPPAGSPKLFRPPWGHQDPGTRLLARRLGYEVVAWNAMGEDWRLDPPEEVVARIETRLAPGSIVLLHDRLYKTDAQAHRDRSATLEAVRRLLERQRGTRFVTVPELLRLGRPMRWHWYKRPDLDWLHRQIGEPA